MNEKGILIVEDENIVALDMRMRLDSLGYRVVGVVDNGQAALDFILKTPPDLVLMDIKLKGGADGIETARAAREKVEVPIIFVTAFTDEGTLERAKLASPYGYIVKPFHERELRIAIELALYKFQYELSMRRSKEIAEEANRVKGEFLANVSHELKTPLNSVIGFTELALDRSRDDEQRDYLSTVLRSAHSLVGLIDSILVFARLENGSILPVYGPFSLDDFLGECMEFVAVGAASKGLNLSLRRDRNLPARLVCDRARVSQILMNLLDNAVKFTAHGHIRLGVEFAEATEERRNSFPSMLIDEASASATLKPAFIKFFVEDTGIGIPRDKIPKAFESFTQLDGSSTRSAGGTGLGLAIVAKSLNLLSGTISVESKPGEGSRFEVVLPLLVDSLAPKAPPILASLTFFLVGFDVQTCSDIEETLEYLGATGSRAGGIDEVPVGESSFALVEEAVATGAEKALGALRGHCIVAKWPGMGSSASFAALGCAVIPLPVKTASLVDAVSYLRQAAKAAARGGRKAEVHEASPASGARQASSARRKKEVDQPLASLVEKGALELGRLLDALEEARIAGDLARAEREAKEYHEVFVALKADDCERLAFSTLLLARKGDWDGIDEIVRRARLMLNPDIAQDRGGGMNHAFPGR